MLEPNPSVRSISVEKFFLNRTRAFGLFRVRKYFGTEPERSVYFGCQKNKFENAKNFDNKINEFGKIIEKIYNQGNYL